MEKTVIKISKNYWKYFALLFPFLFSLSLISNSVYNATVSNIVLVFKLLVFLLMCFLYVEKGKITKFDGALFIYFSVWLLSVLINSGDLTDFLKEASGVLSYVFIIEYAVELQEEKDMIRVFADILLVLLIINAVILITNPGGLYGEYINEINSDEIEFIKTRYNFLGLDNNITPIIIIAIIIFLMNYYLNKKRLVYIIGCITVILVNVSLLMSSTMVLSLLTIILAYILSKIEPRIFNVKVLVILAGVIFTLIIVFKAQAMFSFIITDVLDKDLTLTSRTSIWERVIEIIKEKPVLGYGRGTFDFVFEDRNAHNMLLQVLFQTGVIGLAGFINLIIVPIVEKQDSSKMSWVLNSCLFSYLICCIGEAYPVWCIAVILCFVFHYNKLVRRWEI